MNFIYLCIYLLPNVQIKVSHWFVFFWGGGIFWQDICRKIMIEIHRNIFLTQKIRFWIKVYTIITFKKVSLQNRNFGRKHANLPTIHSIVRRHARTKINLKISDREKWYLSLFVPGIAVPPVMGALMAACFKSPLHLFWYSFTRQD